VLHVGHDYRAGPGESGEAVARRLGMDVDMLLALNFDLRLRAEGGEGLGLAEGQALCVVPSPCSAPEESLYAGLVLRNGVFVPP
jgi:hypothetical protein